MLFHLWDVIFLPDIDFCMQISRVEILCALSAQKRKAKYSAMNIHCAALLDKSTATMIIHSPSLGFFSLVEAGTRREVAWQ